MAYYEDEKDLYDEEDYEDYEDLYDDDDEEGVDNTNVNIYGNLYVRLNDKRNWFEGKIYLLDRSLTNLRRKFPKIAEIAENNENPLEFIIRKEFLDGMNKVLYVRNLSYMYFDKRKNEEVEQRVLGIRPVRFPGSFMDDILPEGQSLIFKGHMNSKEFVVDEIYNTSDDERLMYESEYTAVCYDDPNKITNCSLYDIAKLSGSLTKHTREKLDEWRQYLEWKLQIIQQKIAGCKYIKIDFDINEKVLLLWLMAPSKADFEKFKKYMRNDDLQIYNNSYSSDRWVFVYNSQSRKLKKGISVGKFKGIREEYEGDISSFIDANNEQYDTSNQYEDDHEENDNELNVSIREEDNYQFGYIVKVAYELNSDDMEIVKDADLDDPDQADFIYDEILSDYNKVGFLALSAVGSLALNKRLQMALNNLENDSYCASPNLALWLFDVKKARLPKFDNIDSEVKITKWLNDSVANNEHQRLAVKKMLVAPDLCMIQGPPGTGKTTVIAEAIYQFVRQGKRVLVTSQSNDAVDNALDRLLDTPEIRAIRLGRKGKQKKNKNIDEIEENKYSENLALKCYYLSLSKQLDERWINIWNGIQEREISCQKDLRDCRLLYDAIQESSHNLEILYKNVKECKEDIVFASDALNEAVEFNKNVSYKFQQIDYLEEVLYERKNQIFILDADQQDSFFAVIDPILSEAKAQGIYFMETIIPGDRLNSKILPNYLLTLACNVKAIEMIISKVSDQGANSEDNVSVKIEIQAIKRQIQEINNKIDLLYDEDADDADEKAAELNKEQNQLRRKLLKLQKSSGQIELSEDDKKLFSASLLNNLLNNKISNAWILRVNRYLKVYKEACEKAISNLKKQLNSENLKDENALNLALARAEKAYEIAMQDVENAETENKELHAQLLDLCNRYDVEKNIRLDEVESIIQKALSDVKLEREQHSTVQDVWENTIKGFKAKLNDDENYSNDRKYYQNTYINACNVVGISCTDNMRELTDNGFEDFDVVIVDEVSKATPPEILIPLLKANKAVLVGDHRQLPPMFDEHERSYKELVAEQQENPNELDFEFTVNDYHKYEKMITSSMFKEYFENADDSIRSSLFTQYRMHSDIMKVINRFYEGYLNNGLSSELENKLKDHGLTLTGADGIPFILPQRHAYWLDSSQLPDGTPMYESFVGRSTSACNIYEAHLIIELLKKMADEYTKQGYNKKHKKTVGVISFYQKQVNMIRALFREVRKNPIFNSIDVDINTVDRFQGKEKNIIITSLVRNNKSGKASKHIVAFERINVAFSRAQEMLVIVGAKHLYENQEVELPGVFTPKITTVPVYRNIISEMMSSGKYIDCSKLVTPELREEVMSEYEKVKIENEDR